MNKKMSILREITSASILLALITSCLYISGATYISAYLTEWGVESSLIAINVQDMLVHGTGILYFSIVYVALYLVAILIIVYMPILLIEIVSVFPQVRSCTSKIYDFFMKKTGSNDLLEPPNFIKLAKSWWLQALKLSLMLWVSLFFFSELLEFSGNQGKERAQKEYVNFSNEENLNKNLFSRKKIISLKNEKIFGYMLANSESLAVIYVPPRNKGKEQIRVVKMDSIEHIIGFKLQDNK